MTTRAPRIHTADYIAWYKHITGEWQYNFAAGEIHNTRTGKPVKFHKNSNGYLTTAVRIHNTTTHILKHRAIWIAAHGILALPLDYTLEIHHKNHNPADCRIHNLQLVTLPQNRKNPQRTHGPIPPETVRDICIKVGCTKAAVASAIKNHGIQRPFIEGLSDEIKQKLNL